MHEVEQKKFTLAQIAIIAQNLLQQYMQLQDHKPFVIYLHGDLGAGKTTLVSALLRELGLQDSIPVLSPTFPYIQSYEVKGRQIAHLDLYRLDHVAEENLYSIIDDPKFYDLIFIEWPERLTPTEILPPDLLLRLSSSGEDKTRILKISR